MDIAAWLRSLGMQQYEAAFRDNAIDPVILPELTADDLKDLGVNLVGHRRRLLAAIAALRSNEHPAQVAPADQAAPASAAERRQLTVMFCDLVGSTPLSARLDPEDLRGILGAYHRCVAEVVEGFDGFVARYMGDGVLVYFGYPQAHEDDAERATRCGLALVDRVPQLNQAEELHARVGIATGLVVVGGEVVEHDVAGDTPNLAARLQAVAEPDTVVIAASTRRLLGELFEYRDLGTVEVKGIAAPVPAWQVLGPSSVASRFEALRGAALSRLIGRDEEVDLLLRRWARAKTGDGQIVLISGEPGIGKSRLTAALLERLGDEPHTRLRYFCSRHHQDSALYPFIAQLERAAGFARDDRLEHKFGKLDALLSQGTQNQDEITLIAELLSLPNTAADLNLSPPRKRETLFEALLHQLASVAHASPIIMVFEDAHWIDPTSRELMDLTLDRVRHLPALLVITFRPEFRHDWGGQPHVTTVILNRLGEREGATLVRNLAGNAGLRADVIAEIVERTDGVPLFVEELTKAVLESAARDNRVASVLAPSPMPDLGIPATLHASLIARLDRLGPVAKEVGQTGSVIGREFSYDLIEQVAQRPGAELQAGLDHLAQAGLLFCRGVPPHASYFFKHALVQDAAYGTLLRARRQELHSRVAAMLEKHFADLVERQPELLAHHLTAAGDAEHAVDQWLKAGRYAAQRLAQHEAMRHFERGLSILPALPEGVARDRREIDLQLARGLSLFTAEGYSSAGAAEAYARARELAERRSDAQQLFMAVYGLWQSANGAGRVLDCRRLSNRLQQLTAGRADDDLLLEAHHSAWATCLFAGEPVAAQEHSEAGCLLYDPERHRSHRLLYGGHDPGVCAGKIAAQAYWLLGWPDKALFLDSDALALAQRIAHPFSLLDALLFTIMLRLERGEPALALQQLEAAEALAAEQRLGFNFEPRFLRGAILSAKGAHEDGSACLRDGLASRLGAMRFRLYGLTQFANALTRQGEYGAALAAARDGLTNQKRTGHRQWEAELYRFKGIALVGLNRLEEGQSALEAALRVARRQQAKSYELRAATSLARVWSEQDRRAEARELLAPVYGWFTEGFGTPDLKEAKALLDELS